MNEINITLTNAEINEMLKGLLVIASQQADIATHHFDKASKAQTPNSKALAEARANTAVNRQNAAYSAYDKLKAKYIENN